MARRVLDKVADIMAAIYLSKVFQKLFRPVIDFVYRTYERILTKQISGGSIPRHVAIIPDGNRRWARLRGASPADGHSQGYERLKEVLNWLYELGIKVVTVYAMSTENCLYRPEDEKKHLFELAKRGLKELIENGTIDKYKVRVKVIGDLSLVPEDVRKIIREVEEYSSKYNERYLNIALCYGGRRDIVEAIKKLIADVRRGIISESEIDETVVSKYLSTSHLNEFSEPDLVIRTSGELRISNFLLWQIAYSELYFCDVLWPEFRKIDLLRAIRSYQRRERRFGR